MDLKLEVNKKTFSNFDKGIVSQGVMMTPILSEDNFLYRVKTSCRQAIVGVHKFGTIGIGFNKESDWNCNLPYTCEAKEIYEHIKHNKHRSAKELDCIKAIKRIQEAIKTREANL